MEKSVEFILKKENIPGQVFLSFFSILWYKNLAKISQKIAKLIKFTLETQKFPQLEMFLEKIHFFLLICFSQ